MLENKSQNLEIIKSSEFMLGIAFLLIFLFGVILAPGFLTTRNITNILRTAASIGILTLGQSFVILTGELDLSIGSILSLSVISGAVFLTHGTVVAILITILIGAFLGLINGIFIAVFDIDSLMMTLGTLSVFSGIAKMVSRGQSVFLRHNPLYLWLGQGSVFNIPVSAIIFFVLFILSIIFLSFTTWGKHLYYTGSNKKAAHFSGINTKKMKIIAFTLSGVFAAISGPLIGARVGRIIPYQGEGLEITAIAMAVFGGILLKGGKGSALGVLLGIIVYQTLINILSLSGMDSYMELVIRGLMLIAIVAAYQYTDRKS